MKVQEAVIMRINELCAEKNMNISQRARSAGMPPSTLKNVMNGNSKSAGIVTIAQICDGLGISVKQFFDCILFEELEQEIS